MQMVGWAGGVAGVLRRGSRVAWLKPFLSTALCMSPSPAHARGPRDEEQNGRRGVCWAAGGRRSCLLLV